MAKTCSYKDCDRGCYGEFCLQHKPRKPLPAPTKPIKVKRRYIKPESSKSRSERLRVREEWFELNPPDATEDQWYCYLDGLSEQCWTIMDREQIELHGLEHVVPKVRSRALKFSVENLRVACPPCNREKASQTLEQLLSRYEYWGGPRA